MWLLGKHISHFSLKSHVFSHSRSLCDIKFKKFSLHYEMLTLAPVSNLVIGKGSLRNYLFTTKFIHWAPFLVSYMVDYISASTEVLSKTVRDGGYPINVTRWPNRIFEWIACVNQSLLDIFSTLCSLWNPTYILSLSLSWLGRKFEKFSLHYKILTLGAILLYGMQCF